MTAQGPSHRQLTRFGRELIGLSLLILLAFGLRAWHLDFQSLWRDETDAIRFSQAPPSELLANLTRPGWNGPLYFILLRSWLTLVGDGEFAARYSSLIFGLLAVPLTWVVGRRMAGRTTGAIGAALVALSPYLVWYAQELKMYALVLTLGLFSTYLYLRALGEGRWQLWFGHLVVTSLMIYTHILAVLILFPQALWFLVGWRRYRPRWRGWLVDMAALTLPYLPLAVWQMPLLLSDFQTGHPFYPLGDMVQILFLAFSRGIATPWSPLAMGVFLLLSLGGLTLRIQHTGFQETERTNSLSPVTALATDSSQDAHSEWTPPLSDSGRFEKGHCAVMTLILWLVVPVLAVYLISLGMPIFTDRYLIYVTPAYALLLARGLVGIGGRWRPAQIVVAALLILFLVQGWWMQATHPIKSDFRGAARLVAENYQPDNLIVFQIPYGRYTFEYYFRRPFDGAEGLYTNHGMSEAEAARQMQAATAGRRTVWLVGTEMEMWDQRHLVLQWLQAHGRQTLETGLARVTVWRFEME